MKLIVCCVNMTCVNPIILAVGGYELIKDWTLEYQLRIIRFRNRGYDGRHLWDRATFYSKSLLRQTISKCQLWKCKSSFRAAPNGWQKLGHVMFFDLLVDF